ncbi:hypothetical protein EV126DRAFT_439697 [Verticillium dahliae]|nr:hypothetical protein EV126DRAFT_439697 [Verticillium dahliae]
MTLPSPSSSPPRRASRPKQPRTQSAPLHPRTRTPPLATIVPTFLAQPKCTRCTVRVVHVSTPDKDKPDQTQRAVVEWGAIPYYKTTGRPAEFVYYTTERASDLRPELLAAWHAARARGLEIGGQTAPAGSSSSPSSSSSSSSTSLYTGSSSCRSGSTTETITSFVKSCSMERCPRFSAKDARIAQDAWQLSCLCLIATWNLCLPRLSTISLVGVISGLPPSALQSVQVRPPPRPPRASSYDRRNRCFVLQLRLLPPTHAGHILVPVQRTQPAPGVIGTGGQGLVRFCRRGRALRRIGILAAHGRGREGREVKGTDPLESNDARPGDEATVVKLVDDVELAQSGLDVQLVHGPALVVELHGALLTVSDATSEDQLPAREADSSGAITVFVMICVTVPLVMVMVAQGEVTAGLAVIVSLALDEPVETNVPDGSFDPVPVASVGSRTDPELRLVLPAARVELELPLVVEPAALPVDVILSDGPGDEDDSSPWKSVFVSSGSSEVALDRTVLFAVGNSGVPVGTTVGVKVVTIAPERLEIGRIVRFPALVGTLVLVAFGRGSGVGTIVFGVPTPVPLTPPELVALGSGNGVRFEGVGTPTPVVDDGLMFSELRPVPATELERVLLDNGDVTDWVRAVLVVLDKTEVGTVIFAMLVPVPAMVRDPETVELGIGKGVAPGVIDKGMLVADVLAFGEPTPGPGPDVVEVAFGNGKGVSADGNGDKAVDVGALAFVALMLVLTVASERLAFEGENLVELMGLREGDKVVEALASTVLRPVPAMVPDAVLFERGNGTGAEVFCAVAVLGSTVTLDTELVAFGKGKGVAGGGRELGVGTKLLGEDETPATAPLLGAAEVPLDRLGKTLAVRDAGTEAVVVLRTPGGYDEFASADDSGVPVDAGGMVITVELEGDAGAVGMVTVPVITVVILFEVGKGGDEENVTGSEATLVLLVAFIVCCALELESVKVDIEPLRMFDVADEELSPAEPGCRVGLSVVLREPDDWLVVMVAFVDGNGAPPVVEEPIILVVPMVLELTPVAAVLPATEPLTRVAEDEGLVVEAMPGINGWLDAVSLPVVGGVPTAEDEPETTDERVALWEDMPGTVMLASPLELATISEELVDDESGRIVPLISPAAVPELGAVRPPVVLKGIDAEVIADEIPVAFCAGGKLDGIASEDGPGVEGVPTGTVALLGTLNVDMRLLEAGGEIAPDIGVAVTEMLDGVAVHVGKADADSTGGDMRPGVIDPSGLDMLIVELLKGDRDVSVVDSWEGNAVAELLRPVKLGSGSSTLLEMLAGPEEDLLDELPEKTFDNADLEEDCGGYMPLPAGLVVSDISGG